MQIYGWLLLDLRYDQDSGPLSRFCLFEDTAVAGLQDSSRSLGWIVQTKSRLEQTLSKGSGPHLVKIVCQLLGPTGECSWFETSST